MKQEPWGRAGRLGADFTAQASLRQACCPWWHSWGEITVLTVASHYGVRLELIFTGGLCETECKYVPSKPDFRETGMNIYQYSSSCQVWSQWVKGVHPESTWVTRSALPRCRPSKMVDVHVISAQKVCADMNHSSFTKLLNEIFLSPPNLFSLHFSHTGPLFPRNASCGPASLRGPAAPYTSPPRSATPACSERSLVSVSRQH